MNKEKIVLGILAHVDAGKTTLAENLLYMCGSIRTLGRVDHRDTLLDNFDIERERGITVFSKQAQMEMGPYQVTLLDTPGHVDFSPEMERTLQVLDYGILIVSGADGIQGNTRTLWRLLDKYNVPTFVFINKMDQIGTDRDMLMKSLVAELSDKCVDMTEGISQVNIEHIAMCSEELTDYYLENETINSDGISCAISNRELFPCYFGSALKQQGIDRLVDDITKYVRPNKYGEDFAARVYKISKDKNGARLTHLKVTGGTLKVKMTVDNADKIDQIRVYSGGQFVTVNEAEAGSICAVTGLGQTHAGDALGAETGEIIPVLEPVMRYRVVIPEEENISVMLGYLRELEDEEPQLHITYDGSLGEIYAQVMGEVQLDVLRKIIQDRYDISVNFDGGGIVYKETIAGRVEGVGHFEPLRHYAEVHILIEGAERGSGVQCDTSCSEDLLDKNWQRLILTHMEERIHPGVLTGSELTDVKLTLVAGKAHQKHTEGGDFRQATYRAVRNGLARANNILLEPVYSFCIEAPQTYVGRIINDIQRMYGEFNTPEVREDVAVITGIAPVVTMNGYHQELLAYSGGMGRITCTYAGYRPCHNSEEVIQNMGYSFERDADNPADSVFCAHGGGFVVPWDEVEDYMHVEYAVGDKEENISIPVRNLSNKSADYITLEEIEEIYRQTYRTSGQERAKWRKQHREQTYSNVGKKDIDYLSPNKERYLLVDGYNIIFAWQELRELSNVNLEAARNALMEELCNYQGYTGDNVILVFDAYKVKGNPGEVISYNNISVIYTREAETADTYIERVSHEMGKKYRVTVATSDLPQQCIIWGNGAFRMSAGELKQEMDKVRENISSIINKD